MHECSQSVWDSVCSHLNRAVVFIDNVSAEILHWNGGLMRLLNAGAYNVKEFSSFEVRLMYFFPLQALSVYHTIQTFNDPYK